MAHIQHLVSVINDTANPMIDNRENSPIVTDGPFAEQASQACHRKIEVRPFL